MIYIITTASDFMVINTQDFTLEAWIWNDQTGTYQYILIMGAMEVAVHPLT